jgi:membrane protein required for beta-lactamase induction
MISAAMILLLIGLIILVITLLYAILGAVRFARTGSIREGIRFSAITGTIQAIGWGTYILALVIVMVLVILFSLVISLFGLIPLVGWVIVLVLNPFVQVFMARYISRVYDHNLPPVPAPEPAPAG